MILLLSVVLTMQHGNTFCWIYTETYRDTGYTLEKRPRYTKLMVNVYYVLIISGRFKWCVGYICTRLKTKIRNIDGKYSQLQNIKIIQITPFYPKHIFFNIQTKDQDLEWLWTWYRWGILSRFNLRTTPTSSHFLFYWGYIWQ